MSVRVNHKGPIHQSRVFQMVRENVTLSNGSTVDIDVIRHPGASAIVPLLDDNQVVMVRQYRHAVGNYVWEIPAGTLDPAENPMECARRELTEETGYAAGELIKLGEIHPVPSYSDERIHIFLGKHLKPAQQHLDADEVLDVHVIALDELFNMIDDGRIQDGKTISALFMAMRRLAL